MCIGTTNGVWEITLISNKELDEESPFWCSDTFKRMIDYTDKHDFPNVLGSWSNLLHPEDSQRTLDALSAHIYDKSGQIPYNIDYRLKIKTTGEYRWSHAQGKTKRDNHGNALRIAGSLEDIHDEKTRTDELEKFVTRFELANEMLFDGLWDMEVVKGNRVNPNNHFWWSDQLRFLLGYTNEQDFPNILDSWASLIHPDDKNHVTKTFTDHIADRTGRTPYDITYRLKTKSSETRWFRARGMTKRSADGTPLRVVGTLSDIDAQVREKELK